MVIKIKVWKGIVNNYLGLYVYNNNNNSNIYCSNGCYL